MMRLWQKKKRTHLKYQRVITFVLHNVKKSNNYVLQKYKNSKMSGL